MRVWGYTWKSYWIRLISNDDLYSPCAWESRDRRLISRLSSSSTEVNRNPPMLRYLIPGCTADKFWHFSSLSETHNTHRSLVKGLQGYSLSFGINELCCSTVRKQFSSWLVAVWGKKCLFQLIWVPGYQVQHFKSGNVLVGYSLQCCISRSVQQKWGRLRGF